MCVPYQAIHWLESLVLAFFWTVWCKLISMSRFVHLHYKVVVAMVVVNDHYRPQLRYFVICTCLVHILVVVVNRGVGLMNCNLSLV